MLITFAKCFLAKGVKTLIPFGRKNGNFRLNIGDDGICILKGSTISNLMISQLRWTEHEFFTARLVEGTTAGHIDFCDRAFNSVTFNLISIETLQISFAPAFVCVFKAVPFLKAKFIRT